MWMHSIGRALFVIATIFQALECLNFEINEQTTVRIKHFECIASLFYSFPDFVYQTRHLHTRLPFKVFQSICCFENRAPVTNIYVSLSQFFLVFGFFRVPLDHASQVTFLFYFFFFVFVFFRDLESRRSITKSLMLFLRLRKIILFFGQFHFHSDLQSTPRATRFRYFSKKKKN